MALVLWQTSETSHAQKKGKTAREGGEFPVLTVPDYQLPDKAALLTQQPNVVLAPQAATATVINEPLEDTGTTVNNTPATATLVTAPVKIKGNLFPNGDIDYYRFTATAGSRVYAASITSFSAGSSTDSQLTLFASDGTTAIEFDEDNGSFAGLSSSIAGATIPTTGTYYLRINDFTAGTTSERPYELWLTAQAGAATAEVEPNDTPAQANPVPANGFISGARSPAAATEQDWFSIPLNAGDTVYVGMDLDPERDGVTYNGRLGMALFGDADNQIVVVDDAGAAETPNPTIPSEAIFVTVRTAGTYYVFADSATAATGGPTATYNLSVTVLPRTIPSGVTCTTYTSTDTPLAIGPGAALTSSNITVPAAAGTRIYSIRPTVNLTHAIMNQVDAHLRSPAGNNNGIFTDIGAAATGGQTIMNTTYDDDAGTPPAFTVLNGLIYKPELNYRLGWFKGENQAGVWTLDLYDDVADANGGTLNDWSLEVCTESTAATPSVILYSTAFESGAAGFTHNGTADEWELGTPATAATTTANPIAAFTTCNSGTNCWKTDLDNTYNVSSSQNLVSPNITLTGNRTTTLQWAMKYQMESASFDHLNVQVTDVNDPTFSRTYWQFLDATMTDAVGNPVTNIGASAGWGTYTADISAFAGRTVQIVFHLDSDTTVNFAGAAIDDVSVRTLGPTAANVSVAGKVTNGAGCGVARAVVTMTGAGGVQRRATTNPFGYYRFTEVSAGETYVFKASAKRLEFAPQVLNVNEDVGELNFAGN